MIRGLIGLSLLLALAALNAAAQAAQAPPSAESERGFTSIETFQGELNSTDRLFKLDSNIGYDFTRHFGVFAGMPIYFGNVSQSPAPAAGTTAGTTTSNAASNGIGNAYVGFGLRFPAKVLNYSSTVTAGAPTGSSQKGLSSGRASVDWSNRFEFSAGKFTPFVEGGLANTVPDTKLVTRAFTSLGMVTHFEEGGEFQLSRYVAAGASGYHVLPFGNQKIFSKVSNSGKGNGGGTPPPAASNSGKGKHGIFQDQFFASGAGLTEENGASAWLALQPDKAFWRVETGYSRSITYALNNFTFNLGLNIGKMMRARKGM
jgi:hypothetical protein